MKDIVSTALSLLLTLMTYSPSEGLIETRWIRRVSHDSQVNYDLQSLKILHLFVHGWPSEMK